MPAKPEADPKARPNADFDQLVNELDKGGNLPGEGLQADDFKNGKRFEAQRGVLCSVGSAEIDVAFPEELFAIKEGVRYRLAIAEPPPDADSWPVRAVPENPSRTDVPGGSNGKPWELGKILRDGDELVVLMNAHDVPEESPDAAALADVRAALVTAAVKITNRNDPGQAGWVQLGAPVTQPSIELKKFFFDVALGPAPATAKKKRGWPIVVPRSPWPVELRVSKAVKSVHAAVVADRPDPGGDGGPGAKMSFAIRWSAQPDDDPFLETAFESAPADEGGGSVLRLLKATLLEPWGSYRRLGRITDAVKANAKDDRGIVTVIREADDFEREDLTEVSFIAIRELAKSVAQANEKITLAANEFSNARDNPLFTQRRPLVGGRDETSWNYALRQILAQKPSYREWLLAKYPHPNKGAPAKNQQELTKIQQWENKIKPKQAQVSDDDFTAYWKTLSLSPPVQANGAKKGALPYPFETLVCLVLEELAPLAKEKQETLELIKALGAGTVALEGEVVVEFPSIDATSVLGRFADPGDGATAGPDAKGTGN